VWSFHDFWPITGHCTYFSDVQCEKWITQCYSCPKLNLYPKSFGFDNSKRNYILKKKLFSSISNLTIIPVSKWAGTLVEKSFLKNKRIIPIYNGVDLSVFKPQGNQLDLKLKYGFDSNTKVLLALATTWGKRKGWFDYLKLAEKLPENIKIVLVGVTQKQKQGLPTSIIAMAKTESVMQLAELYSLADIVMNLSYQETFGLTTVEGFACGTPSIVYNCTASPELMSHDVGELVEPGDLDGIVNAINILLERGKEFYFSKCIERAKKLFSHEDRFNDYINLYQEIISNK
jgi:glycosyltransferase involved in cell wall biosynthesis